MFTPELPHAKTGVTVPFQSRAAALLDTDKQILWAGCGAHRHPRDRAACGTGAQAVRTAGEQRFDLILMDVQMPEIDGLEAMRTIREAERNIAASGRTAPRVPVVALTAHALRSDLELCLSAGMDGYISKPINLRTLVETIERTHKWGRAAPALEVQLRPPERRDRETRCRGRMRVYPVRR